MVGMSNKSLALLVIAAIVISLGGTLISLNKLDQIGIKPPIITGRAEFGKVNVSVTSNAACKIDSNVSFGSDAAPGSITELSSNLNNPGSFTDCSGSNCGMQINNTGNEDLNVTFSSAQNASFIGGPDVVAADFEFMSRDGDNSGSEGGCQAGTQTWATVDNSTEYVVCSNLTSGASADMMTIEYNLTIRPSTSTGTKQADITIDCSQAT